METIQVVMEGDLVKAAEQAARRLKINRSALIREALRRHLERIETRELERRDREGYRKHPDTGEDARLWC